MLERMYQRSLIKTLNEMFPGCIILKNDSGYIQGIPDLLILHNNRWAALEVKAYRDAPSEPNQAFYINEMNRMSFAAFIYPEIEDEVLDALQQAL